MRRNRIGGLSNMEQNAITGAMGRVERAVMLLLGEQRRTNQLLEVAVQALTQGAPVPPRPEPLRFNWRGKPKD